MEILPFASYSSFNRLIDSSEAFLRSSFLRARKVENFVEHFRLLYLCNGPICAHQMYYSRSNIPLLLNKKLLFFIIFALYCKKINFTKEEKDKERSKIKRTRMK